MTEQYLEGDAYLDGNALAGPLSEIFAVDITAAAGTLRELRAHRPGRRLRLYVRAPGLVARCPGCDAVMLRLVRVPVRKGTSSGDTDRGGTDRGGTDRGGTDRGGTDRGGTDRGGTDGGGTDGGGTETAWLDLRGAACLQIPIPPRMTELPPRQQAWGLVGVPRISPSGSVQHSQRAARHCQADVVAQVMIDVPQGLRSDLAPNGPSIMI